MKHKVLILTTVSGFLPQFEKNHVKILQQLGAEVHFASNFEHPAYAYEPDYFEKHQITVHHFPIEKSPYRLRRNYKVLRGLIRLIDEEKFTMIHCHTPVGGVLGRLAGRLSETKPAVVYTAHGFHFYKEAPLKNWLLYYPAERLLARFTDCIVTINREDFKQALKFRMKKNGCVQQIPGVGIDLERFGYHPGLRKTARELLGVEEDEFCLMTAALLDREKNYQTVLDALSRCERIPFRYFICGEGPYRGKLEEKIRELGLEERVQLLGFRRDLEILLQGADLFLFPSLREGLGMAPLEAMACGVPVAAAENRGTREYLRDGVNGILCGKEDSRAFREAVERLYAHPELRRAYQKEALRTVKAFAPDCAGKIMFHIYQKYLPELPDLRRAA